MHPIAAKQKENYEIEEDFFEEDEAGDAKGDLQIVRKL